MAPEVSEGDWKVFREVRKLALDRLCERALRAATAVAEDRSKTHHERFLGLCALVAEENERAARAFDDPKRSAMILQLALIHKLGLLEAPELARFSDGTRERIASLASVCKPM